MSRDAASTVTLALLLIFDTFVMYWIFTAIVDTRRTLRLRKNYVKLAMYNHFSYTLMFAIVASLGFVVWALVTLNFPARNCLTVSRFVCVRVSERENVCVCVYVYVCVCVCFSRRGWGESSLKIHLMYWFGECTVSYAYCIG